MMAFKLVLVISLLFCCAHAYPPPRLLSTETISRRTPNDWPIKTGYVAFGDSFAAGMGTGTTSTDPCRIGSNNFGALLDAWTNNDAVAFQQKACSGDTTIGLNRQIDEWTDPQQADVATVSMGGNDLKFSDLAWWCILTPTTWRLPATNKRYCNKAMDAAMKLMSDTSADGLTEKLKAAYARILEKSGRSVSRPVVALEPHESVAETNCVCLLTHPLR